MVIRFVDRPPGGTPRPILPKERLRQLANNDSSPFLPQYAPLPRFRAVTPPFLPAQEAKDAARADLGFEGPILDAGRVGR